MATKGPGRGIGLAAGARGEAEKTTPSRRFGGELDFPPISPQFGLQEQVSLWNPSPGGFPPPQLVMVVNGNDEAEGDDGGEVPASTGIGVMILVLLLFGTGAYALLRRRRSASP